MKGPPNPFVWSMDSHDFWAHKVEKVGKAHFLAKSALWAPKIIEFTSENIRAGALGSLGGAKWWKSAKSGFWSVLTEKPLI